jgi:hypothetical protein
MVPGLCGQTVMYKLPQSGNTSAKLFLRVSIIKYLVRFEILEAVAVRNTLFGDVMLCPLVEVH